MTERDLARLQQDDDAEDDDALGENQRHQDGEAGHEDRQHARCADPGGDRSQPERLAPRHQIVLARLVPNKPSGRTSKTITMRR